MDRDYPISRAELEDKENWPYNRVQSLASDLDYGNPVGEAREDLIEYAVDELELPEATPEPEREVGREVDRETDRQVDRESAKEETKSESLSRQESPGRRSDGGTTRQRIADAGADTIEVGHEGSEKLQPAGAPDSQGTAVEPPGDLESEDIDRNALEGDPARSETDQEAVDEEPDPVASDDVQEDNDSGGGLRDRLGLGSNEESPDDIVEEVDDADERERREQFRQTLEGAMDGADQDDVDEAIQETESSGAEATSPASTGTTTAQGMVVDEEIVGNLIEMPFNTASAATGWDGWELSAREREANARLFVAMCDEHDVNVGPTVMFALSMGGTSMGRAMQYKRYKSDQEDDVDELEDANVKEDVDDRAGNHADHGAGPTPDTGTEPEQRETDDAEEDSYGF